MSPARRDSAQLHPLGLAMLIAPAFSFALACNAPTAGPRAATATAPAPPCSPTCDGTRCDDGCGGSCACATGTSCGPSGACVPQAQCTDTCTSTGHVCGEVCGEACGSCADEEACFGGVCIGAEGCADCALELAVVERTPEGDGQRLTVAVLYHPTADEPRARLADVRLRADGPVQVASAQLGEAATRAGKSLYVDSRTGHPWVVREDGTIQLLVHSFESTEALEAGRLLTLELTTDSGRPRVLSLVRRSQVLAPASADAALQTTAYDRPVAAL